MAVTKEAQLINAICRNKDIATVLQQNVDDLLGAYGDVWESLKGYHRKYSEVPDIEVLVERFPDLEVDDTKINTKYALDELKSQFINARLDSIFATGGSLIGKHAPEELLGKAIEQLGRLSKYTNSVRDLDITDYEKAEEYYKDVRQRTEEMGGSPGIPTGIDAIDASYVTGMAPGHMITLIGWSGRKKSYVSALMACNAYRQGFKPLIFTLEMTAEQYRDRVYTIFGSGLFSQSNLIRGDVDTDVLRTWGEKQFKMPGFHIIAPDGSGEVTPSVVEAKIEQYNPDIVILDYAQLMSDNRRTEQMTSRMMNLSKEIKRLATSCNIPVVAIISATENDAADRNSPPQIEQSAWSKQFFYDSDLAMAVHGEKEGNHIEIVGRKNRYGMLFDTMLDWDIENGIIKDVEDA